MILEILISTMDRDNLSFLNKMFGNDYGHLQLLIINQTTQDKILESSKSHVRVINSFEYGLSKSRNLAIKNAVGDICLVADDDIEYVKGFDKTIITAYKKWTYVNAIVFSSEINNIRRNPKYLKDSKEIKNIRECVSICSVEISFKLKNVREKNIYFNELMGINSKFPAGEEFVFLNDLLKSSKIYYINEIILKHKSILTTTKFTLDENLSVYAVQYHLIYNRLFFLYLTKLVVYLLVYGQINFKEIFTIYNKCIKSRKDYIMLSGMV